MTCVLGFQDSVHLINSEFQQNRIVGYFLFLSMLNSLKLKRVALVKFLRIVKYPLSFVY